MNTVEITNPQGTETLGEAGLTSPAEVAGVVEAAVAAKGAWAGLPVVERAAILESAAATLTAQSADLGRLLAAESGKPLAQAEFEVAGAVSLLRGNAEEGRRLVGRVLPTEGNPGTEWDLAFTRREPLGVVAAILPFNFPVELFVEKCAAALVAGNAVVAKPPLEDPLAVGRFAAALQEAGMPPGALGLVRGGAEVGAALAEHRGVDAISLTGSTAAGLAVARAAAPRLGLLHLELGGNNACLVLDDADLDLVAGEAVRGRLMMNGQACSATKRILVPPAMLSELEERLAEAVAAQRVGPSTEPETTVGPLITPAAAERVEGQVRRAREQGARLAAGDGRADGPFFGPCLLSGVPSGADVARDEEIFGPVFCLIPAADEVEAVRVANASSFGLMASVFSGDPRRALRVAERLEVGGVVINGSDNYRPPVIPFGGVKLSGAGREGLGYTIRELSREKAIVMRRFRAPAEGS
ncbi:MAG: aldehyde dehydrogenase family protein [Solirubrobacterales bacterium]